MTGENACSEGEEEAPKDPGRELSVHFVALNREVGCLAQNDEGIKTSNHQQGLIIFRFPLLL